MKKFTVNSQKDLYILKDVCRHYDEINIDLKASQLHGLIRHAVKYSNHALADGGTIVIHSAPFKSYVLRKDTLDFWQVKYEVFGSLKDSVDIIEVNAAEGQLVLKKKKHVYNYSGISFGIVFSGNKEEETQLFNSIDTIIANEGIESWKYEILICGPTDYPAASLSNNYKHINLRYIALDIATKPRLMICEKKNFLYEQAKYSIVSISHSRIQFPKSFIRQIHKYPIEMATPAVYYKKENKTFKYLDLGFMDSYQDIQLSAKRSTVAGENIQTDYLHWYRKRVPYIDGGLNIFNKDLIKDPPYNNYISWGEAEDVDVCNRLFQTGILIDYLPDIKCFSATCKLTGYTFVRRLVRKIFDYMNKKRILN